MANTELLPQPTLNYWTQVRDIDAEGCVAIALRPCHKMPGTDLAYCANGCYEMCSTDPVYCADGCYKMSGTDLADCAIGLRTR
eukprot:1558664-Rhodomonas_salina.2